MISESARWAIRRDILLVEEKYYNVYFSRQNVEYDYGKIFSSDRDEDEREIRAVYLRVTGLLNTLPPGDSQVEMWKALFMSRLSELETDYEEKLRRIDEAIEGLERNYLIGDRLYEYTHLLFEKCSYLLDRREKPDSIEAYFVKAEDAIRRYEGGYGKGEIRPQAFIRDEGGSAWIARLDEKRNAVMDDWAHLKAKLYLARAIFRADAYDRIEAGEIDVPDREQSKRFQLGEEELYLKKAETILKEEILKGESENEEDRKETIELPCLDTEEKLRFLPYSFGYNEDKSVSLNYLSTRAFYHLRKARERGLSEQRRLDQVILALRCYVAGYLYDLHNMISMDNIAYICYSFGEDAGFKKALQRDVNFRVLYSMFSTRLMRNLEGRIAYTIAYQTLAGILDKVREDVKRAVIRTALPYAEADELEVDIPESWVAQIWKRGAETENDMETVSETGLFPLICTEKTVGLRTPIEEYFRNELNDGMHPCPLLPPWGVSADTYLESNGEALKQTVHTCLETCWGKLAGELLRVVSPATIEPDGYYVYLDGQRKVKISEYGNGMEGRLPGGDMLGRIVFRNEAEGIPLWSSHNTCPSGGPAASSSERQGMIQYAVKESLRIAGVRIRDSRDESLEMPNPYALLDWLFTVSRGG